jgi:ABC-type multidrug transport system ATPase subunit
MHIELQNVGKTFGRTRALKDFHLNVPPSSVVALLGENGAGKSTLLRILAGLCVPDSGVVRYDGEIFDRENIALRKRLHFTPDMPLLFPDQTVARNIATFAALYEKPTAGREEYLAEWLEETGSAALMRRTVARLSRGQIWKAGLGCVAAIEPELWLVDEPFASGMDALGMGAFRRLAKHLADQRGTIIYTTQMVEMAAEFSDHVCVIREGGLVLWESSAETRRRIADDPNAAENILRGHRAGA